MTAVLFVDDEPMILKSIKRGLRDEPYQKFYAHNGDEALEVLEAHVINVLVTDMRKPEMNGLDLLKAVKILYPNIVSIVLSGNTQVNQMDVTINQGDSFGFLLKPWDVERELKPAIRKAIEYAEF
jgi:two-component system response regulator HupR/HoxA